MASYSGSTETYDVYVMSGYGASPTLLQSFSSQAPADFVGLDGKLYFQFDDPFTSTYQIWSSDGTIGGTETLNIGLVEPQPGPMAELSGELYFSGKATGSSPMELFETNGSSAGTVALTSGTFTSGFENLTPVGGTLLFTTNDGKAGDQLWASTSSGTAMLKDIHPGGNAFYTYDEPLGMTAPAGPFAVVGGKAYFTAGDGIHGPELWSSDGSAAGTTLVADIDPGRRARRRRISPS